MTAKTRELLEEIVWEKGEGEHVYAKTMQVCKEHAIPSSKLKELEEWACQQSREYSDKWVKIMHINNATHVHNTSARVLQDHHRDTSTKYSSVARGIRAVMYGI